jgi:hypothetical protein
MTGTPELHKNVVESSTTGSEGKTRSVVGGVRKGLVVATASVLRAGDAVAEATRGARRSMKQILADARERARQMTERAAERERAAEHAAKTPESAATRSDHEESHPPT